MDPRLPVKTITDNVVKVVDDIYREKNYPSEVMSYLYLATTGLMLCFGENCVDRVFNALQRTSFIEDDYYDLELYFATNNVDINYNVIYINEGFKTLENYIRSLIEILTHSYNLNDNERIVSDVIRALKTEEIIKTLYKVKNLDMNDKVKDAFKVFDEVNMLYYYCDGDNAITNLFRPLFKYNFIKDLFNRNLVDGSYREIYKEFDNVLGHDAFSNMIGEISDIKSSLSKKEVNTYDVACSYLNVRNNFVQSYISLKFNTI